MTRARAAAAIGLVATLVIVGAIASSALARGSTTITVGDDFFSPSSKTIRSGTKVKFKWIGTDTHDVVKKKGPGPRFDSGTTDARGVNFTKKLKKVGTYRIICTVHPDDMKLKLRVK